MYVGKKGEVTSRNVEACAGVANLKQSHHRKETAKQNVENGNLYSLQDPSKTTKIFSSSGFGSIVANVNKQKSLEAGLIEPFGQYSRAGGTFGALRKQSVSDNAVKEKRTKHRW